MLDTTAVKNSVQFEDFIASFKSSLKNIFLEREKNEEELEQRGFSKKVLSEIMAHKPLSVAVPKRFGGRGLKVNECLSLLQSASYESLSLSLIFGINFALFLEPFEKYGNELLKSKIFNRFINHEAMGGLMISEPDFGSDALSMQSSYKKSDSKFHIQGTKHWQGLTGMADYWLVASKEQRGENLSRDLDLFVCEMDDPKQKIEVLEFYKNSGLLPIPYGKNSINAVVPEENKLTPESTGLKMFMDTLHRSRLQFPGMAIGFIQRILDEAINHCSKRKVSGKFLVDFDQVKQQILEIQSSFTICSAMCSSSADKSGVDQNLALEGLDANATKSLSTDLMQRCAQTFMQLLGSTGYKTTSLGTTGILDSRPFRIFEGPNEVLYTQVCEAIMKMMRKKKIENLFDTMMDVDGLKDAMHLFKKDLNVKIEQSINQRKQVILGQIISWAMAADKVIHLANKGFQTNLIDNTLNNIKEEISNLMSSFNNRTQLEPILEYKTNFQWESYYAK